MKICYNLYLLFILYSVAQVKSAQEKLADELHEMAKPLARYRDDEDLERMLKEREREGDPMLKFIKKKKDVTIDKAGNKRPRKGYYIIVVLGNKV